MNSKKQKSLFSQKDELSFEEIRNENCEDENFFMKINNFVKSATQNRFESNELIYSIKSKDCAKETSSLMVIIDGQSKNFTNDNPRLEITNKSIFYTPSTICNYYLHSENDGSPKDRNNYTLLKNKLQFMNDSKNENSSAKSQIKYTKSQLQSGEKSAQQLSIQKVQGNMSELVKEIKKELVLVISSIDGENNSIQKNYSIIKRETRDHSAKLELNCKNEINIQINPLEVKNMKSENIEENLVEMRTQNNINFSVLAQESQFSDSLKTLGNNESKFSSNSLKCIPTKKLSKVGGENSLFHRKTMRNISLKIPNNKKEDLELTNLSQKNTKCSENSFPIVRNIMRSKNNSLYDKNNISIKNIHDNLYRNHFSSSSPTDYNLNNFPSKDKLEQKFKCNDQLTPICTNKNPCLNNLNFIKSDKENYVDINQLVLDSNTNEDNSVPSSKNVKSDIIEVASFDLVQNTISNQSKDCKKSPSSKKFSLKNAISRIPKTTRNNLLSIKKENAIIKPNLSINKINIPNAIQNKDHNYPLLYEKKANSRNPSMSRKIDLTSKDSKIKLKHYDSKKSPANSNLKKIDNFSKNEKVYVKRKDIENTNILSNINYSNKILILN